MEKGTKTSFRLVKAKGILVNVEYLDGVVDMDFEWKLYDVYNEKNQKRFYLRHKDRRGRVELRRYELIEILKNSTIKAFNISIINDRKHEQYAIEPSEGFNIRYYLNTKRNRRN